MLDSVANLNCERWTSASISPISHSYVHIRDRFNFSHSTGNNLFSSEIPFLLFKALNFLSCKATSTKISSSIYCVPNQINQFLQLKKVLIVLNFLCLPLYKYSHNAAQWSRLTSVWFGWLKDKSFSWIQSDCLKRGTSYIFRWFPLLTIRTDFAGCKVLVNVLQSKNFKQYLIKFPHFWKLTHFYHTFLKMFSPRRQYTSQSERWACAICSSSKVELK